MIKTPVCQIVGYKNSGKTTFMSKLINYYTSKGFAVGALKHHGHGGEPNAGNVHETDSAKHLKAGAAISGVQGESRLQLSLESEQPLDLTDILRMYELSNPDIILVEGYKYASFPKVVLLRGMEDEQLLKDITHPVAVGSWNKELLHNRELYTIPLLEMGDCIDDIATYIQNKVF